MATPDLAVLLGLHADASGDLQRRYVRFITDTFLPEVDTFPGWTEIGRHGAPPAVRSLQTNRSITAQGLTVSASDLIRLALSRLQEQVPEKQLHKEVAAHVLAQAELYPGPTKRGLPTR